MSEDKYDSDIVDDCEIDIFVIDEDENPVENEKVTVFWGLWYGNETDYTDEDGHVKFWVPNDEISGRATSVEFYVKSVKYEYSVGCGYSFTINIDED